MPQADEHQPDPVGDGVALAAAGCIVGGIWWIYAPAGLITLGLFFALFAFARARS